MNPQTPSSPGTLDYAKPRRQLNWRGAAAFALIGFLIVTMCFNLTGLAFYLFWPITYTRIEVLSGPGVTLSPVQLVQHRSALTSSQFLSPIASRNGLSVQRLQSGLTVLQSLGMLTVSFTSRDPVQADTVARDVVMTYAKNTGLVAPMSIPTTPPMARMNNPLQILSQAVAAGFGLVLVIFLARTNWGRRRIWMP